MLTRSTIKTFYSQTPMVRNEELRVHNGRGVLVELWTILTVYPDPNNKERLVCRARVQS